MAAPSKKKSHTGKILAIGMVLFIACLVGFGYMSQTSSLRSESNAAEAKQPPVELAKPNDPIFRARANDIVLGNADAPVTIVEYSSLSCPHCAHFHEEVLPKIKKSLLDSGTAKLVLRHFPLNEPALRAAQLVECAAGEKRYGFIQVLFSMQSKWAFGEGFKNDLKTIAAQGGIDSAAFDSCMSDTEGENAIIAARQEGATKAGVNSTPYFFINGEPFSESTDPSAFIKAVESAAKMVKAKAANPDLDIATTPSGTENGKTPSGKTPEE